MAHPPLQNPIGLPFIELLSVDSTNNYALEQVYAGLAHHGTAFFAHEQVAGKGQRGKTWVTEKDTSLIMSVVIKPPTVPLARQFELSACIAMGVQEFFCRYAGDATKIKWPNDLYWHDRKAGGMLIENVVRSGQSGKLQSGSLAFESQKNAWQWAIVGIGININQEKFSGVLQKAVSLKQITGKNWDTVLLAKELCDIIGKNFMEWLDNGFGEIYNRYQSCLYKKGQLVKFKKGSRTFEAVVKTVSPVGQLVIQHAMEEELSFGEIEWLIPVTPDPPADQH